MVGRAAYVCVMLVCFISSIVTPLGWSQTTTGLPPFSTVDLSLYDDVKINDGAVLLTLHVRNKPGLIPFDYSLNINSAVGISGVYPVISTQQWTPQTSVGFSGGESGGFQTHTSLSCSKGTTTQFTNYEIIDGQATVHRVNNMQWDTLGCYAQRLSGVTTDGSGLSVSVDSSGSNPHIMDRNGDVSTPTTFTDSNGNTLSFASACSPASCPFSGYTLTNTYTDTTLETAITETQTWTLISGSTIPVLTADEHSWTDAAGHTQAYTVNYSPYTHVTHWGCYLPADNTSATWYMPSSISAPDGTYTISYEATTGGTTGRIAQVTFPSGAAVQYTYTGGNNGLTCEAQTTSSVYYDIMVPVLTRTLIDTNGTKHVWKYDTTVTNNETVVTDPAGNDTVYWFYTNSSSTSVRKSIYETQRQIYQGSWKTGTLLKTILTCYNGNTTSCASPSTAVGAPITEKDVYTTYGGMMQSAHLETTYDGYGNLTEATQYDFNGSLISDRTLTYGSYSGGSCSAIANIRNRVCSDTTKGASGAVVQQTNNTYDSLGNLTASNRLTSGSTYLTTGNTYNANGSVNVVTDVNGAQTSYGNYVCNGNFPTTVSEPLGLSRSMTWDCNGGVVTSTSDENSQKTTIAYVNSSTGLADFLYRPASVTDPLLNVTTYKYSPTTFESAMNFNGSLSTVDTLSTTDGFGHTVLAQTRQAQGSSTFDTIQYKYDADFRSSSVTMPCQASAGQGCPSAATTNTTYDGASRPLQVTDGGGGYTSYAYTDNDVLVTVGPAPSGENTKKRQFEYDGGGRLTSVCELTSAANGGGTCAQTSTQTGYWAKYSYDALNDLVSVSQNAQSSNPQGRTFVYDGLTRLTSETNPENGTTTYTYDSYPSGTCGGWTSEPGDLMLRTNNDGSQVCYVHDALHRVTDTGTSAATGNVCRRFRYDTASNAVQAEPTGFTTAGSNLAGQVVEAETDSCTAYPPTSATMITDEWFMYSARGENTDLFESTPNSSGYYHTTAGYFGNGVINSLGGVPGLSSWTFGTDGEGRMSSAKYGTTTFVSGTTYYPSVSQTTVSFGTGDSDVYGYDANTGRMNQFRFTVGSTPESFTGVPAWNPNWTLGSLAITDQFKTANQNCTYVHDDLSRIKSVNCVNGSTNVWNQTFTYDAFGNISKSGTSAFAASYLLANGNTNNQEQTVGSCAPTYDGRGNLTKDCTFSTPATYTWDIYGNPTSLKGVNLTYDALDREVQVGTTAEIIYSPLGKLGIMNGQAAATIRIPLPGGSTAELIGPTAGINHILHPDWLGSVRISSLFHDRSEQYDIAYGPFGESYDGTSGDLDFTGSLQDTLSGLYDFSYRYYNPVQGRWISADPSALSSVDPTNPQSWNRYAYVLNNPLGAVDPLGLDCVRLNGDGSTTVFTDAQDDCAGDNGYYFEGTVSTAYADANQNVVASVDGQQQCQGDSGCAIYNNLTSVTVNGGSAPLVGTLLSSIGSVLPSPQLLQQLAQGPPPMLQIGKPHLSASRAKALCFLAAQLGNNGFNSEGFHAPNPGTSLFPAQGQNKWNNLQQVVPSSSEPSVSVNPNGAESGEPAEGVALLGYIAEVGKTYTECIETYEALVRSGSIGQ